MSKQIARRYRPAPLDAGQIAAVSAIAFLFLDAGTRASCYSAIRDLGTHTWNLRGKVDLLLQPLSPRTQTGRLPERWAGVPWVPRLTWTLGWASRAAWRQAGYSFLLTPGRVAFSAGSSRYSSFW